MMNKFAYDSLQTMLENEIASRQNFTFKVTKMPRNKVYRITIEGHKYGRDGWSIFNAWKNCWIKQTGKYLFHGDEAAKAEWNNLPIHVYGNRIEIDFC